VLFRSLALLLSREAVALDDSADSRSALLSALQRDPAAIATMHASGSIPGDLTQWIALSPDGKMIAAGGARPTVELFDAMTYRPLRTVEIGTPTTVGDFRPDGHGLVVAADRQIVSVDVDAGAVTARVAAAGTVGALRFPPTGDRLITAERIPDQGWSLVARDPVTLDERGSPVPSISGPITAMDFSADDRRLVTTGLPAEGSRGHTTVWDARDLEPVGIGADVGGNDVALSPDGRTAAIAAAQSSTRSGDDALKGHLVLLDLASGSWTISKEGRRPGSQGPPLGLTGLAFSADGRSVISTGDDQRVVIWDVGSANPTIREAFDDPAGLDGFTPVMAPDGSIAFTIDAGGSVIAWDLQGSRSLGRSFVAGSGDEAFPIFAVSPDGRTLAVQEITSRTSGSVRLVDTTTMDATEIVPRNGTDAGLPVGLAFSPDGETLAITSPGGYVQLWDVRTGGPVGSPLHVPDGSSNWLWAAAFSPDGSLLAVGGADPWPGGIIYLWNVATGRLVQRLPHQGTLEHVVGFLHFTPDGTELAATTGWDNENDGGDAIVWDLAEGRPEVTIHADSTSVNAADLSDDGTTLVTAGPGGEKFWDLANHQSIGPGFQGPSDTVDLSPDGRTLVATGAGQVVVRDVATGTILGRAWFPDLAVDERVAAAYTQEGDRLFVVTQTGEAWVWEVDPTSLDERACRIAGRSLTEAEWRLNLPDRPYRATCGF